MTAPIAEANPYTLMSLASMFIALMTLLASLFFNRRTESHGFVERLEDRNANLERLVEKLEADLKYCRSRVQDLLEENMGLLRKFVGVTEKAPTTDEVRPDQ